MKGSKRQDTSLKRLVADAMVSGKYTKTCHQRMLQLTTQNQVLKTASVNVIVRSEMFM